MGFDYASNPMCAQQEGLKAYSGDIRGNAAAQPDRAPAAEVQIGILEKELIHQRDVIGQLDQKLSPVMSVIPASGKEPGVRNESTCPLVSRLEEFCRIIAANSAYIKTLMSRLEI